MVIEHGTCTYVLFVIRSNPSFVPLTRKLLMYKIRGKNSFNAVDLQVMPYLVGVHS